MASERFDTEKTRQDVMVAKIPLATAEQIDALAIERATFRHAVVQDLVMSVLTAASGGSSRFLPGLPRIDRARTRSLTLPLAESVRVALDRAAANHGLSRHQTLLRVLIPAAAATWERECRVPDLPSDTNEREACSEYV